MGPADHTEFLGPQIYTLTTGVFNNNNVCIVHRCIRHCHIAMKVVLLYI